MNKKIACIIPARLNSSRFPEKILSTIGGKPLMQWVFEAANKTKIFDCVLFAIDSQQAANLIKKFNGKYIMTSQKCVSGTDRLIEVMNSKIINADIWVNWQCDEPFITKKMITQLLKTNQEDNADVWTLKKQIINKEEIESENVVKVVCDSKNFALYFSRHAIPFKRENIVSKNYFKHIGIYAYTTDALKKISCMKQCHIEKMEKLEQLRFLYNGLKIKVNTTNQQTIGIDHKVDLQKAEIFIKTFKI
jgi:3-deoxy-manno-octulosonate cytidylyltransferase (CMP-KDO synthetase)